MDKRMKGLSQRGICTTERELISCYPCRFFFASRSKPQGIQRNCSRRAFQFIFLYKHYCSLFSTPAGLFSNTSSFLEKQPRTKQNPSLPSLHQSPTKLFLPFNHSFIIVLFLEHHQNFHNHKFSYFAPCMIIILILLLIDLKHSKSPIELFLSCPRTQQISILPSSYKGNHQSKLKEKYF